ncbi:phosphatase PAP2 family protein [Ilumatobacter coccineus]|uniref:Inositolphosphotransferase Aur1/Ipt1 domain-containing protein n=1 Tax=Ilumatobacter coccineus (strain NBRC 103263 / KCTC 29153 / YM16-304) TaxID=1313172 RepID=A0A6C7EA03_ILUCY|nr:phosphatase PAP2 family protein [Ilumatobacter coccineus]BAN03210.1 hypothetical protein YM304_28960 [Ilumatobacter coccineus YM16-304]
MIAQMAWPTWQQAWVTTVLCIVVYLVLRRVRPSKAIEIALPAVREFGILTALYGLWRTARKLPLAQTDGAIERARTIVDVQEAMWLPSELTVNRWAVDNDWLGWLSSAYYVVVHVPSIFAFLIWMFWRHRDHYDRWRNALALVTAGCLVIRFWRVAPPRYLPDLGFIDVTVIHDMDVYGPVGTGVSGQFVAMPSIHVAWAGVVGLGIVAASTSRWKWLFAAHLPLTIFVVSATGHHWWLDGIVALLLLGVGLAIDEGIRRLIRARRLPSHDEPDTTDTDDHPTPDQQPGYIAPGAT